MEPRLIYISCPYSKGDVAQNVRNSILAADCIIEAGHLPYNPLLSHFHHLILPHSYDYWLDLDLKMIYKCEYVVRLNGESVGADKECELAKRLGIPIILINSLLELPNALKFIV